MSPTLDGERTGWQGEKMMVDNSDRVITFHRELRGTWAFGVWLGL
jgi:hypothetical protein